MSLNWKIALWFSVSAIIYIFINIVSIQLADIPSIGHLIIWGLVLPLVSLVFGSITIAKLELSKLQKTVWISIVFIFSAFWGAASFFVITAIWGSI
ncbi:MAG: hypothetical protein DRR08_08940 [Candidatus Parabeggiatoa sp. nov. 2]|nr:MAG: hypothetical protein DRR08_08940 [Gammaproteobacteria bacterium]